VLFSLYHELAFKEHTTNDYQHLSDAEASQYRFFSGHGYRRDWIRLPTDTMYLTILRDPVDRAVSLYRYWNTIDISHLEADREANGPQLEAIGIARARSIEQFVMSENGAIMEHLRGAFARQLVPDDMVDQCMHGGSPATVAFEAAVETLFSIDAVLTTERLDQSFSRAMTRLGLFGRHAPLPHENASTMQLAYDRGAIREIMMTLSPIDFHLYAVAKHIETRHVYWHAGRQCSI
jgi:hypothetical protein